MRSAKPWLRESDGQYCIDLSDGTRLPLGKNKRIAEKRWRAILRETGAGLVSPTTLHELLDKYEAWLKANRAESTYTIRKIEMDNARAFFPAIPAEEVDPDLVSKWIASQGKLSPTTVSDRITNLMTVFNWGVQNKYITANPIAGMPKPRRRVREEFVPPEQFRELIEAAGYPALREFLVFMLSTGARTEEMFKLQAKHFNGSDSMILPIEDSKGRRRSRRIYLPAAALAIVAELIHRHPEGPLFRNSRGKPMTKDALKMQLKKIREQMGLPRLCATMLRHSFAHAKISEGEELAIVSKLMGHVDTRQVYTRYGHLEEGTVLRDKAMQRPVVSVEPEGAGDDGDAVGADDDLPVPNDHVGRQGADTETGVPSGLPA